MREKRWPIYFLIGLCLTLLSGCGGPRREQVTVALWSDQLTERYGQYLQRTFPEVDFTFYIATNSTDFYRFKDEAGDLPDILTLRRFSLRDVADWKDSLLDLSDTELASTFHQSYLRSYTYSDGTVNWLPACGEVDSILVNRRLLEDCGLEIPTDYQSFVEVCGALRERGIRPFASNFAADYACMEVLQGLSAARLASQEGREWRQRYESGQTDSLDEALWLPVFERMAEFTGHAGISAADLEWDTAALFDAYRDGQVAMIRGTSAEASRYGVEEETLLLPYWGESAETSWYLTYPAFQAAASVRAEESPERRELILDILSAMLNQEGLRHIATGRNMIAYNRGVELELSPMLAHMPPCIDGNRLYIRLASSDMFSISRQVVQGMIAGDYPDARSALDAFNAAAAADEGETPAAARIETGWDYAFRPDGGSPAASAVMNSLREELGTQLLVGQAANVAGNIRAGDYTGAELQFLTMGEAVDILLCSMTGDQLCRYVAYLLTMSDKRGSVVNDSTLYVSSGFEMEIARDGDAYRLEGLTAGGRPLDREAVYSVALLGNEALLLRDALDSAGVAAYTRSEAVYQDLLADRLLEGRQLAPPTNYITLLG